MELDRQEPPAHRRDKPAPPQRIPEANKPLLGDWFIYLSVIVLIAGVVVITALNFGAATSSALVRVPGLVGAALLIVLSADAAVRVWRSAWAWLPIDRTRGLFRFVWAALLAAIFVASIGAVLALLAL